MNWRPFDTHSFLKASRHWDTDIKKLDQEMDALLTLPSIENSSGVRSSNISDMTAQTALRRLKIASQIEEIQLCKAMLDYALKRLPKDERELVNGFYFSNKARKVFVQEYGRRYGMCETYVYEKKTRVLQKMGDEILREYYGEE